MKGVLLLIAGGILFYVYSRGKGLQKLEFYPKNIDFKAGKLYLVADLVNPSNVPLTIDAIFANINYNGIQVGRIQYTQKLFLPALNSASFGLPIIADQIGLGSLIADIVLGKKLSFNVIGTVSSMGVNFPFQNELGVINTGQ